MHELKIKIEDRTYRRIKSAIICMNLSGNRGGEMEVLYQSIDKIFNADSGSELFLCLKKYKDEKQ